MRDLLLTLVLMLWAVFSIVTQFGCAPAPNHLACLEKQHELERQIEELQYSSAVKDVLLQELYTYYLTHPEI